MQGKQKKQHAQHVLPLGCPCHGLDVDGMKRKQSSDHEAAPAEPRGALEQKEEKHGVGRVQQDTHRVMSRRVQAKKLAVESVGKPGQGMPVRLIISGKSPFHCLPRQARPHMRVVRDVLIVVIVEEPVVSHGAVEHNHNRNQYQTQQHTQQQTPQQGAFLGRPKQLGGRRSPGCFQALRCHGRRRRTHGHDYCDSAINDSRDLPRDVSPVSHNSNRFAGTAWLDQAGWVSYQGIALAMPEAFQIDAPLGAGHTTYGCSCGAACVLTFSRSVGAGVVSTAPATKNL